MMDATTTLNQLTNSNNGINRLSVMVGGKHFVHSDNFVQFKFPAMKHGARFNFCKITLNADDTYTMRFSKIVKHEETKVVETSGLYCDMIKANFEETTGLYLSL